MKKFKLLIAIIFTISITGCFKNDSMEDISISTSVYPIKYIVDTLYGDHSEIDSIYPMDSEIIDFEVTDVLLEQYKDTDLFIFNGLSDEKNYVKTMRDNNNDLKIIDVTAKDGKTSMVINYSIEELWLDPNNLLTIANNIKTGFDEYIKSTYLINEINENYNKLKEDLTSLDGKFYSTSKNASNKTIIVSDDAFLFLKKYGIDVISLDKDTRTQKDISEAKELLINNDCNYIYIKYTEEVDDSIKEIINETNSQTLELYTMTNLYEINTEKNDYLALMNQNLENLKMELYK